MSSIPLLKHCTLLHKNKINNCFFFLFFIFSLILFAWLCVCTSSLSHAYVSLLWSNQHRSTEVLEGYDNGCVVRSQFMSLMGWDLGFWLGDGWIDTLDWNQQNDPQFGWLGGLRSKIALKTATMIIRRRTVCHDFGDFSLSEIIENSITKLKYVGSNDKLVTPQLLVVFYLFIYLRWWWFQR